ncbi:MAG: hypothetical protein ABIQ59_01085 [Nocardioidaceae bacterium]
MSTRVYVPTTLSRLRAIVTVDGIGPAPFVGHGVTPEVRATLPDGGEEEWEYAASTAAAQSSLGMLHENEPARRVVIAVDVPTARAAGTEDPTVVEVDDVVPFRYVGAVLADAADAEADVAAARDALAAQSEGADGLAERCLDHELGWWAAQEIGDLLSGTGVV